MSVLVRGVLNRDKMERPALMLGTCISWPGPGKEEREKALVYTTRCCLLSLGVV